MLLPHFCEYLDETFLVKWASIHLGSTIFGSCIPQLFCMGIKLHVYNVKINSTDQIKDCIQYTVLSITSVMLAQLFREMVSHFVARTIIAALHQALNPEVLLRPSAFLIELRKLPDIFCIESSV